MPYPALTAEDVGIAVTFIGVTSMMAVSLWHLVILMLSAQLSNWMPYLYRPMTDLVRRQIKLRATAENRELTKKTVKKGTTKTQVTLDLY